MTPAGHGGLSWRCVPFAGLALDELYEVLQLRSRVFVVEQACPFLDADGRDAAALHLLGWGEAGGERVLAAYARLFAPGLVFPEASIGRVVTHPDVRRTGAGKALMAEAIRRVGELAPGSAVRIGAQRYLERFYGGFGFVADGGGYIEDGIPHVEMVRGAGFPSP